MYLLQQWYRLADEVQQEVICESRTFCGAIAPMAIDISVS